MERPYFVKYSGLSARFIEFKTTPVSQHLTQNNNKAPDTGVSLAPMLVTRTSHIAGVLIAKELNFQQIMNIETLCLRFLF